MSENSKIEWTDHTFNPWIGCTRVSPGCDHCYAAVSTPARAMKISWGASEPRHRTAPSTWKDPIKWNARHDAFFATHGRRQRVFCASLADVFDNAVPDSWRMDLFQLIGETPNLDWLLLTKRIGNVRPYLQRDGLAFDMLTRGRAWLGATIVNQTEADRDIPKLLDTAARVRFLSIEPLLGPIDLDPLWLRASPSAAFLAGKVTPDMPAWTRIGSTAIDWVIVGGESGCGARPMHPDWARSLRDQCATAGVPFLFKQQGEWREPLDGESYDTTMGRAQRVPAFIMAKTGTVHCFENEDTRDGARVVLRVGKKAAGRVLDGRTHDEFPRGIA